MDTNPLSESITSLKGVGPKVAERLARLSIHQVKDILFHLPLRYQDRTRLVPMKDLVHGQESLIEGSILSSQVVFGRRRALLCHIEDGSARITLRFFHFSKSQMHQLSTGARVRCFGEIRMGRGLPAMLHPEYQVVKEDVAQAVDATLTPIYPTTDGLHQLSFRKLIVQALVILKQVAALPELIPDKAKLLPAAKPSLVEALNYVHQPPPDADIALLLARKHPYQRRLAYEELLAHQVSMQKLRVKTQIESAPILNSNGLQRQKLLDSLPFALTGAQQRVTTDILEDMAVPHPMQRLVQGDVGSGKTVVAALAMIEAVASGYQAVLMAPTELLAEQHFQTFSAWLNPLGITVGWCASKQTASKKRDTLAKLAEGTIQLAVGTHALFQDAVRFNKLGLVVIDEQHRFGVHQRMALMEKGQGDIQPHQLVMTATPIPRTLAMTAYADLDVSMIDELPPGRSPVKTVVIPEERRGEIIERVHAACNESRQVYWVCTLIDESEHLQCQAAENTVEDLQEALADLRIGLVHGRLKSAEKEAVMQRFKAGELDLLVATTVIEVGVDVPNASLMVIENAERLGLAQLHQLRGRVGRGSVQSHCVLMYASPLSKNGQTRLSCLRDTNDGFEIAEQDLLLRGPGELLGTRQTGLPQFRVADLIEDQDLLAVIPRAANIFLSETPDLVDSLVLRWFGDKMDLGQV